MRGPDKQPVAVTNIDRRSFLFTAVSIVIGNTARAAHSAVTRPVVSEKACPLDATAPVAADGHRGLAVLRKPPGAGHFPVVVWFHGGIATVPLARLEATARDLATGSRFLAAGYVFVAPTYRSRRKLPYVDRQSIVVGGCSGGGDLALHVSGIGRRGRRTSCVR